MVQPLQAGRQALIYENQATLKNVTIFSTAYVLNNREQAPKYPVFSLFFQVPIVNQSTDS